MTTLKGNIFINNNNNKYEVYYFRNVTNPTLWEEIRLQIGPEI